MEHRRRIWRAIQLVVRILPSALTLQAAGTVRTIPHTNRVRRRTEPACNTALNNIRLLPVSLRPSTGVDLQCFLFSYLQSFVVFKSLPKVFKSLPKVGLDNSQADSPFSSCMVCAAATAASLDSYLPSQGLTTGTSICFVIQPHSIVAAIDRININTLFITKPLFLLLGLLQFFGGVEQIVNPTLITRIVNFLFSFLYFFFRLLLYLIFSLILQIVNSFSCDSDDAAQKPYQISLKELLYIFPEIIHNTYLLYIDGFLNP